MELAKIEKWIEKYFEGTTTVEEEKALRTYFSQDEVASHLRAYQPMFRYFTVAREEKSTKELRMRTGRKKNYAWLSVAATVAIALGIWFSTRPSVEEKEALVAYQETVQALYMIGENLNKGTDKIEYLNEFEETKNKILPPENR
ncbi:hypothetical protein [Sinomicrobium weinanense]|uniref:Uncharacterized protein n=1 Tax=Sinomicrobium weinanense TaxID=2842200 RepID=A0A926JPA1_9FLAO|nr:hypothetical protein [Sinomicrobium weinanense]MBC9794819.1 hypothetical protein [Sinomicrobium weinanense]MBU3125078.1 hypothetical protein [Sinomicrobium weinanense]